MRTVLLAFGLLYQLLTTEAIAAAAEKQPFDRLYVFGDSYSDTGAGYVDGDGPTAVAYLAERLGLRLLPPASPNLANDSSLNFAVSGAQSGEGKGRRVKDTALLGYGMKNQVADFATLVQDKRVQFTPARTLFYLAGGLNDRRLPSETTLENLTTEIRTLYDLGARHFRIAVLPERIPEFAEVGKRLNPELAKIPAIVKAQMPDAEIGMSGWGHYFDEVRTDPAKFGIANTSSACAGRAIFDQDATPCAKPETYFYYHSGHPSTAVHEIVGGRLYQELTEKNH